MSADGEDVQFFIKSTESQDSIPGFSQSLLKPFSVRISPMVRGEGPTRSETQSLRIGSSDKSYHLEIPDSSPSLMIPARSGMSSKPFEKITRERPERKYKVTSALSTSTSSGSPEISSQSTPDTPSSLAALISESELGSLLSSSPSLKGRRDRVKVVRSSRQEVGEFPDTPSPDFDYSSFHSKTGERGLFFLSPTRRSAVQRERSGRLPQHKEPAPDFDDALEKLLEKQKR